MRTLTLAFAAFALCLPAAAQTDVSASVPQIRKGFADWMLDQRAPGLVWGIVQDGRLVHVEGMGVQDLEDRRPVTADSAFRIASMSKAFTAYSILKLRDAGKLRLDDLASEHVPEMKSWGHGIRVADLMHHTAGYVTDDPWGDRQQVLSEVAFTKMLAAGVPFQSAPGTRYEYSNFGYATLGRIVGTVSGQPYQVRIRDTVFRPLGMASTTFEVRDVPQDRLARGYRWENGRWLQEPMMPDGAFGAMGGVVTTANDYAKWVAHLLQGWPADAKAGGEGAMLRDMRVGGGFVHTRPRPGRDAPDCRAGMIYAAGLVTGQDCLLGTVMFHSGGYPGYGSHMLLFPEAGVGIFAFSNRTYAAPLPPVWDAAGVLLRAGALKAGATPLTPALRDAYAAVGRMWTAGTVDGEPTYLAMNMLMDRSAANWAAEFSRLKAESGDCDTSAPIVADGALSGRFQWRCTTGRINGQLLLAPTATPQIQALGLSRP